MAQHEGTVQAPPGMVHVPAGAFLFGRNKEQANLGEFWIDATPVTNAQYLEYLITHHRPSPPHWPAKGPKEEHLQEPVVYVSYAEAAAFAEACGKSLPTPAQYEKAARGTDGRRYPWGDDLLGRVCNTRDSGIGGLTLVDRFAAGVSPYGCYDMVGNVQCWTRAVDPETGDAVVKGTSFREFVGPVYFQDTADRSRRFETVGFRCVWKPS